MKKIENECVRCGLPCLGYSCPNRRVVRFYCDKCGKETTLRHYEEQELCADCLIENFEVVEGSEEL